MGDLINYFCGLLKKNLNFTFKLQIRFQKSSVPHCVTQVVVDSSLRFIVGYLIQARKVALFAFIINVACLGNAPRGYCESIGNTVEPVSR